METVDRFSAPSSSASSLNESPRQSRSTRHSNVEIQAHARDTPASSTMENHEPRSFLSPHSSNDDDDSESSCFEDPERWLEERDESADPVKPSISSESLPTREQISKAADMVIYDAEGNSRPFRHLYQGSEHQGQRQMIIFVRHFYCSVCQSYIKALIDTITPARYFALPTPTTITIIGCGRPSLLRRYMERTSCPFRMYVDPTRRLYKALGMSMAFVMGKKPEYNSDSSLQIYRKSFGQMFSAGLRDTSKGGNWIQVGGEFLFENGQCIWCHRMGTVRGHTETSSLSKVLETSEEDLRKMRKPPKESRRLTKITTSKSTKKSQLPDEKRESSGKGAMKLVWEDRGIDAPPRAHLRRSGTNEQT